MTGDPLLVLFLLLVGLILIAVELVFIPGVGFLGVAGLGVLGAGFMISWVKLGTAHTIQLFFVAAAIGAFLAWRAAKGGAWNRLVNRNSERGNTSQQPGLERLIGRKGTVCSKLRPAGLARIDGRRTDVIAEGGFIEEGEEIEVIRVDANRVVVKRLDPEGADGG